MKEIFIILFIVSVISSCTQSTNNQIQEELKRDSIISVNKLRNKTINDSLKRITDKGIEVEKEKYKNEYEIIKTSHNRSVQNFHVLYKKKITKDAITNFIAKFKKWYCTDKCNINIYDSKSVISIIDEYPLPKNDYIKLAEHFVAECEFESNDVWFYPYMNIQYKEYGGKKSKPIDV